MAAARSPEGAAAVFPVIDAGYLLFTGRIWDDPPVEIGEEPFSETQIIQDSSQIRSAKRWAFSCNCPILLQTVACPEVPVRVSVAMLSDEPLVALAFEIEGRTRSKLIESAVHHWSLSPGYLVDEGWSVVLEPQFSPTGSHIARVSIEGRRA